MNPEPTFPLDTERQSQDWWRRQTQRRRHRGRRRTDLGADLFLIGFVLLLFVVVVIGVVDR